MKECKYCRSMYEDSLSACPNCGGNKIVTAEEKAEENTLHQKEIENREKAIAAPEMQKKKMLGIVAGVVVVIIFIIAIASYNSNKPLSNGMSKDEGDAVLAKGISYYESGDYESAIECFVQLPTDSEQYEEAQKMMKKSEDSYVSSIVEKANGYINESQYEVALELLKNAQTLLPENADLQKTYNDINATYKALVRNNAIKEADEYANNKDYASAISVLTQAQDKVGAEPELTTLIETYSEEFAQKAIVNATSVYKPYDINALSNAQEIISNALTVLPENNSLQSELQKYKDLEPISLLDLEVDHSNSLRAYFRGYEYAGEKKDTLGNSYSTTIVPSDWFEESHPYGWSPTYSLAGCEWNLGYQYSKITGTVCFDGVYANSPIEIELTIMNSSRMDSGSKKVFTLNSSAGSKSFDVDLTGAKTLYLGLEQSDIGGTYSFLANVYLWK